MRKYWKDKIRQDLKNQEKRKRESQRKKFEIIYYKPKMVEFVDRDKLDMDSFRVIPKNIMSYYKLSKTALAVYPVLCSKADFEEDKTFHISQNNIAFLAGVSENAVREATKELEKANLLIKEKITGGTCHYYVYKVDFIRKHQLGLKENTGIYFYTCIIYNGIWANLRPRAKTLYLAMRATAIQDLDVYSNIESMETGEFYEPIEYDEYIRNRKWDICYLSISEICRIAGIERSNIDAVLAELEKYKLIERIEKWTKVYLKPKRLLKY